MPTICLLFYARALVYSFTVSLAYTSACRKKKCHIICDVTFAASVGILQVLSCIQYTNSLMITYVCCHLFTTYTIVMLVSVLGSYFLIVIYYLLLATYSMT